jgi:valyl-tRNA synthetase
VKEDEGYVHHIATNSRGGGIIEPQIKRQWFVGVNKEFTMPHSEIPGIPGGSLVTLKGIMRTAVESGAIQIAPARFEKVYYHWIDNLRDWCISRQIWFGHRVPVWYRGTDIYCGTTEPDGDGWEQDPDTLDTWFSSGLWTFSTLGWPDETADLRTYHPTAVLETGYDILFFWVARMILMSGFLRGQVPFKHVYLHGLVRDAKGRKMSKSLGNIIDPLDMSKKYGADATRLSLIIGAQIGNDLKLSEDRVRGYKHFANKLWNIARFVVENTNGADIAAPLTDTDAGLIAEAQQLVASISAHIDGFRLDLAADAIYHYVWDRFAAEILEQTKPIMRGDDEAARASAQRMLYTILVISLKLLHPFMPFVTEAIWQKLPEKETDMLMIAPWPARRTALDFSAVEDIGA